MEQILKDRVQNLFLDSSGNEKTLHSIRLSVLAEAASALGIPLDPLSAANSNNIIALSPEIFRYFDEAWYLITGTFSDNRITHQDKSIREHFFAHKPHYVDRTCLFHFLNVLVKRDTIALSTQLSMTKTCVLYRILGVDGFRGILPAHLRNYIHHLNDRLPPIDEMHVSAIRSLYPIEGILSGTIGAAFVLYALLRLYLERVGCRIDHSTRQVAEKAVDRIWDFISEHSEQEHPRTVIKKLKRLYRNGISNEMFDAIAFRKLIDYSKNVILP